VERQDREQRDANFREKQTRRVIAHYMAAKQVLSTGTRKVLLGFGILSIHRGGGTFAASMAEVAMTASVSVTTAYYHKKKLVELGWLKVVYEATPNTRHANRYQLTFPSGTPKEVWRLSTRWRRPG
jgi:hypothetical protein